MDQLSKRLAYWEARLRELHADYVNIAQTDPQKAGHSAERIWEKVVCEMIPPTYRILSRSYMGSEVDLIVLPSSAPSFYDDAEAIDIPNDVASAVIHVKNSLDRKELRDAMGRIHLTNNDLPRYQATLEREREGLPSAVVALGSGWQGGFSSARKAFLELIDEGATLTHPSQVPGFIGTPEWDLLNYTYDIPANRGLFELSYQGEGSMWNDCHVAKLIAGKPSGKPIHAFVMWLYTACAASDRGLEPMRVNLSQMFGLTGVSSPIPFKRDAVYSPYRLQ